MVSYQWVSPTSTTDSQAVWTNDANAIDGNYATYAYTGHGPPYSTHDGLDMTPFLQLNLSALMWVDRIRFKYQLLPIDNASLFFRIEIWNQTTGVWDEVMQGGSALYAYLVQHEMLISVTYTNKLRVHAYISGTQVQVYEVQVEQVIPDDPVVPPKADPSTIKTTTVEQQATAVVSVGHGSRLRCKHKTTSFKPVIIG